MCRSSRLVFTLYNSACEMEHGAWNDWGVPPRVCAAISSIILTKSCMRGPVGCSIDDQDNECS